MARRNTAKNTAENAAITPPEVESPDALGEKLAMLRELNSDDIRASLYDLESESPEFLTSFSLEDFTLERVAADFGGGKYRVQFRDARNTFKGQSTFQISRRHPRRQLGEVAAAAAPQQLAAAVPAPAPDPMREVLTAMIAANSTIVAAIAGRPAPAPPPPAAPLSDAIMLELLKSRQDGQTNRLGDMRELLALSREIGQPGEVEGDTEGPTMLATILQMLNKPAPAASAATPQQLAAATPSARLVEPIGVLVDRLAMLFELATTGAGDSEKLAARAAADIKKSGHRIDAVAEALQPRLLQMPAEQQPAALQLATRVVDILEGLNSAT